MIGSSRDVYGEIYLNPPERHESEEGPTYREDEAREILREHDDAATSS